MVSVSVLRPSGLKYLISYKERIRNCLGLATEWIEMLREMYPDNTVLVSVLRPSGLKCIPAHKLNRVQCLGLATEWIEIWIYIVTSANISKSRSCDRVD